MIETNKGHVHAQTVVFAVPPPIAAKMNIDLGNTLSFLSLSVSIPSPLSRRLPLPPSFPCFFVYSTFVARKLEPYFARPNNHFGGGIVVFLGVPESEVEGQELLHHQLLQDYSKPQGTSLPPFLSFVLMLLKEMEIICLSASHLLVTLRVHHLAIELS